MSTVIYSGQDVAKDSVVGDRQMNRYAIFNGLELPRRIDKNLVVTPLGLGVPATPSVTSVATAGSLVNTRHYAYRVIFGSFLHVRPVPVLDDTLNASRGNPSSIASAQSAFAASSMDVSVTGSTNPAVTHVFYYRSVGQTTQAAAESGPFHYVGQVANSSGASVTLTDGVADTSRGVQVETDNNDPNAYAYAIAAYGYIFMGGNFILGTGYTVTLTGASSTVTASQAIFWDGIVGWTFKATEDGTGGVDGGGLYFANYASSTTLELIDADGNSYNYNGGLSGAGHKFTVSLPGNVLRWSKKGTPESSPLANAINFEGDITGLAKMPNLPLLIVSTDEPSMWILDLTLIDTASFITSRRSISDQYHATSHYSFTRVEGRLRAIDANERAIIETDGVSVIDISSNDIPDIFEFLEKDQAKIRNWHCQYDSRTKLFGAFVTLRNSPRIIDFMIGQNTITHGWFFNHEKDLLSTGRYSDPITGENMILGGTEGTGGTGAVWGRIWCPDVYDDWIPQGTLRSGTILSATSTVLTVDNTSLDLFTSNGGVVGRWVLVTDADGANAQLGYISANTVDTMTINAVVNGVDATQFSPVPDADWLFYLGLIEIRWGPKRWDFGDPDNPKKIDEVHTVISNYNTDDLPLMRVYRGLDTGFLVQRRMMESTYREGESNQGLYDRYKHHGEPMARFGLAIIDRSYDKTTIRDLSIVFRRIGESSVNERK